MKLMESEVLIRDYFIVMSILRIVCQGEKLIIYLIDNDYQKRTTMIKHMVVATICLLCACSQQENVKNESSVTSKCTQAVRSHAAKLTGCFKVQFDVDNDGVPKNIKVTEFLLNRRLDNEIIKAVAKWRKSGAQSNKVKNGSPFTRLNSLEREKILVGFISKKVVIFSFHSNGELCLSTMISTGSTYWNLLSRYAFTHTS
ncbi:MAG: energy transducer TonB [Symbiopectobacterium sp.]|uniref:energy transducer TonB family protein n=1 Tax=Symbiopectobacterium sp. TaxID=2952789 RepID=UPI0039EBE4E2